MTNTASGGLGGPMAVAQRINSACAEIGAPLSVELRDRPGGGYIALWRLDLTDNSATHWPRFYSDLSSLWAFESMQLANLAEGEINMNIFKDTNLFPYMSGMMFNGRDMTLTIRGVKLDDLQTGGRGTEKRPVVMWKETGKGLVLNKTNAKMLAKHLGPETDDWVGARVTLYATDVDAFGETHRVVRVRSVSKPPRRSANPEQTNNDQPLFEDDQLAFEPDAPNGAYQ